MNFGCLWSGILSKSCLTYILWKCFEWSLWVRRWWLSKHFSLRNFSFHFHEFFLDFFDKTAVFFQQKVPLDFSIKDFKIIKRSDSERYLTNFQRLKSNLKVWKCYKIDATFLNFDFGMKNLEQSSIKLKQIFILRVKFGW